MSSSSDPRSLSFVSFLRILFAAIQIGTLGLVVNLYLLLALLVTPFSSSAGFQIGCGTATILWGYMQRMFEVHQKAAPVMTFSGDEIPSEESAIVFANHLCYNDYLLIHAVALRSGMLGRCRYFAKRELVWQLPLFGISLWLIGMVLVDRRWTEDEKNIAKVFRHIRRTEQPIWLISYLEGTRKTDKGLMQSQSFCKRTGKPILEETLYPRTKGFLATVAGLRNSHVKAVYDFTLVSTSPAGFQQPLLISEVYGTGNLQKAGWKFHCDVKRTLISDLPESPTELAAWVEDRWVQKDRLISSMRSEWTNSDSLASIRRWNHFDARSLKQE